MFPQPVSSTSFRFSSQESLIEAEFKERLAEPQCPLADGDKTPPEAAVDVVSPTESGKGGGGVGTKPPECPAQKGLGGITKITDEEQD